MYGYYRSGKKVYGLKSIPFVHLIRDDGVTSVCAANVYLTITENRMGKPICRGCRAVIRNAENAAREKQAKLDERKRLAEFTATMF